MQTAPMPAWGRLAFKETSSCLAGQVAVNSAAWGMRGMVWERGQQSHRGVRRQGRMQRSLWKLGLLFLLTLGVWEGGWSSRRRNPPPLTLPRQQLQLLRTHGALFEGSSRQQPGVASSGQQDYAVAPSSLLPHVNVCFAWAFNSSRQLLWELRFA